MTQTSTATQLRKLAANADMLNADGHDIAKAGERLALIAAAVLVETHGTGALTVEMVKAEIRKAQQRIDYSIDTRVNAGRKIGFNKALAELAA